MGNIDMLTFKRIKEEKDAFIYEYYPEGNTDAPGIVRLYHNGDAEMVKMSDDDFKMFYGGHALWHIDKTKTSGTIAWY